MADIESDGVPVGSLSHGTSAAPRFLVEADVSRSFYTVASHRALVRSLRVTNVGHEDETDMMVVSVRAEAVGAPSLLEPWRREYPVPRRRDTTEIDVLTLRPNLIQLASLDEAVRGDVVVSITMNGELIESVRYPVDFLAYNQLSDSGFRAAVRHGLWSALAASASPGHREEFFDRLGRAGEDLVDAGYGM